MILFHITPYTPLKFSKYWSKYEFSLVILAGWLTGQLKAATLVTPDYEN